MTAEEVLKEGTEIILDALKGVTNTSVFPDNCETFEYVPTIEDGVIVVPTKFSSNGEQIFLEVHCNLTQF